MCKKSWVGRAALLLLVGSVGCAQPGGAHFDLGHGDRSIPSGDLGGVDQSSAPGDQAVAGDGAAPSPDLAGRDLSGADLFTPCTLVPQSGCNTGEKCSLGSSGNVCLANGTVATGAVCGTGGADDCLAGNLCSGDKMGATTLCRQFCNADGDCKQAAVPVGTTAEPGNVGRCIVTYTGTTAKTCSFACNPVAKAGASGCPSGLGCTYGGTTTIPELTDCATPGATAEGGTCTDTSNCAAGLVCVGPTTGTAHCRAVCRNATNGDCPSGDTCFAPATPANPMFGFCCPSGGC